MPDVSESVTLTASQAACLDAVRAGLDSKARVAITAKRDLAAVSAALEALRRARLVRSVGHYRWRVTRRGQSCAVAVVPDPERRLGGKRYGKLVAGSSAERLLKVLDRPMRGADLVEHLGITPQRVHQLVVKLHALGRLRFGDEGNVLHIIARSDDPSLLLARDEERVLSAMPEDAATNAARVAAAAHMSSQRTRDTIVRLHEMGLIEDAGMKRRYVLHRLTPAGSGHLQRRQRTRRAAPMPLAVRSNRVRNVLSYIAAQGAARIKEVGNALEIPHNSVNALMQYLKRIDLVQKSDGKQLAPYELTSKGRETLEEMIRRGRI